MLVALLHESISFIGLQEEEDARKLLEQALQLQISDMMDAIKVLCAPSL